MANKFTLNQKQAIVAAGNLLVSAGAGSGKTYVLTQRILKKILEDHINLKELIVLTFTKDAASNMKERIRSTIKKTLKEDLSKEDKAFLKYQLDHLDEAKIQTFDSFTDNLVRQYGYLINVSDDFTNLDEGIEEFYYSKFIDQLFSQYDRNETDEINLTISTLIELLNCLDLDIIAEIVKEAYFLANRRVDFDDNLFIPYFKEYDKLPKLFFDAIEADLDKAVEVYNLELAGCFLDEKINDTIYAVGEYLDNIVRCYRNNDMYGVLSYCASCSFPKKPGNTEEDFNIPFNKIKSFKQKYKEYSKYSFTQDAIYNNKEIVRCVQTLINIIKPQMDAFKIEHNAYTFMDVNRLALKLLENEKVRYEYMHNTNEIMVDEYQDNNDIQEALIKTISKNNVFCVGDVKQSIYLFRNANPELFKSKFEYFKNNPQLGQNISLPHNFRSYPELVDDINHLFDDLMIKEYGSIDYKHEHHFVAGKPQDLSNFNHHTLLYRYDKLKFDSKLDPAEIEAHMIAQKILEIMKGPRPYINEKDQDKPWEYKDFCVLAERKRYFKTIERILTSYGIPVKNTKNVTFLNSDELSFVISVLHYTYDAHLNKTKYLNQYALEILRSFVCNISDNEIHELFYHPENKEFVFDFSFNEDYKMIIDSLIKMYETKSLSEIINQIYLDFNIYNKLAYLGNIYDCEYRLEQFIHLAESFNQFEVKEFFEYLNKCLEKGPFGEDIHDLEYDKPLDEVNAVQLMTIHKSKGLEFEVVFLCHTNNNPNNSEPAAIFDNEFGLWLSSTDSIGGMKNMYYKLMKDRKKTKEYEEEIRKFYVAMTRAISKFIIIDGINYSKGKLISENKGFDKLYNIQTVYQISDFKFNQEEFNDYSIKKIRSNNSKLTSFKKTHNEKCLSDSVNYGIIQQEGIKKEYVRPSVELLKVEDSAYRHILNLGNRLHKKFEYMNIRSLKCHPELINDIYVKRFIETDLIQQNEIINEYHEYSIFDADNHEIIVDLIVETPTELIVIDYKTAKTDKDAYLKQVNTYINTVKNLTDKKVTGYLYSITKGTLLKVE